MAVYRYATKDLAITTAESFLRSITSSGVDSATGVYYVVLGGSAPYENEPTPILPTDNEQYLHYDVHRNFIGGKKINANDASHVIPRYNWTSGTVYSMYRDTDEDRYR